MRFGKKIAQSNKVTMLREALYQDDEIIELGGARGMVGSASARRPMARQRGLSRMAVSALAIVAVAALACIG